MEEENSCPQYRLNHGALKIRFQLHLLVFLYFQLLLCVAVDCQSPQNVSKNVGELVVMSCSSKDTGDPCQNLIWTHYSASKLHPTVIFNKGNLSSLFSDYISIAGSNDGHCNLEIKTRISAEGMYECISPSNDKKESALLIILDGYPECAFKTVGEYSNITCWVKYFGDWAPTIDVMTGQNSTSISSNKSSSSEKIVSANIVVPRNVPSSYKFVMKFKEQGRKTKTTATNVPDYEWISPIIVLGEHGGGEGEGAKETACPQQMCSAGSFGFNGRVVIVSLFPYLFVRFLW